MLRLLAAFILLTASPAATIAVAASGDTAPISLVRVAIYAREGSWVLIMHVLLSVKIALLASIPHTTLLYFSYYV